MVAILDGLEYRWIYSENWLYWRKKKWDTYVTNIGQRWQTMKILVDSASAYLFTALSIMGRILRLRHKFKMARKTAQICQAFPFGGSALPLNVA